MLQETPRLIPRRLRQVLDFKRAFISLTSCLVCTSIGRHREPPSESSLWQFYLFWLVVYLPPWNISKSVRMINYSQYIGKNKMFQTTNQYFLYVLFGPLQSMAARCASFHCAFFDFLALAQPEDALPLTQPGEKKDNVPSRWFGFYIQGYSRHLLHGTGISS